MTEVQAPRDVFKAWGKIAGAMWDSSFTFFANMITNAGDTIEVGEILLPRKAGETQTPFAKALQDGAGNAFAGTVLFTDSTILAGYGLQEVEAVVLGHPPTDKYTCEVWLRGDLSNEEMLIRKGFRLLGGI